MDIPHEKLRPETLDNLIEHFVLREGTDYGMTEHSINEKISSVKKQLEKGKAKITYDMDSDSYNIIPSDQ
ncbi:MAG: YheU family protein [Oligoflexales bacterium]|nr:YheU family protein [Oligoflexales bacterium]